MGPNYVTFVPLTVDLPYAGIYDHEPPAMGLQVQQLQRQAPCENTQVVRIYLSRTDLDVEVAPLVGNLEDLWPGEAVDP